MHTWRVSAGKTRTRPLSYSLARVRMALFLTAHRADCSDSKRRLSLNNTWQKRAALCGSTRSQSGMAPEPTGGLRNAGRKGRVGDETAVKRSRRTQLLGRGKKTKKNFTSQMGDKKKKSSLTKDQRIAHHAQQMTQASCFVLVAVRWRKGALRLLTAFILEPARHLSLHKMTQLSQSRAALPLGVFTKRKRYFNNLRLQLFLLKGVKRVSCNSRPIFVILRLLSRMVVIVFSLITCKLKIHT